MAQAPETSRASGDKAGLLRPRALHLGSVLDRRMPRVLNGVAHAAASICIVGLLVLVIYGIIGREWLGQTPAWVPIVENYLMIWLAFVGYGSLVASDKQPRIVALVHRLPPAAGRRVSDAVGIVQLLLYWWLFQEGIRTAIFIAPELEPSTGLSPLWWATSVPIGGAIMVYFQARTCIKKWLADRRYTAPVTLVIGGVFEWALLTHHVEISANYYYEILIAVTIIAILSSLPLAEALLISCVITYLTSDSTATSVSLIQQTGASLENFEFVAVPLFLLVGALMVHSGTANRLVRMATGWLSWLPGGLAVADIGASAIFADISGSAVADTVAIGSALKEGLSEENYPAAFSSGMQAAAGTLGLLFPPSVSLLLYAFEANLSVNKMFAANLLVGLVVMTSFMIYVAIRSAQSKYGKRSPFRIGNALRGTLSGLPAAGTAVVILGGMFTGLFVASESGAVGALYIGALGGFVYRTLDRKALAHALADASENASRIMLLIAVSISYGHILILNGGPQDLINALTPLAAHPIILILVLMIGLALVHTTMETAATIVVFVPLILPILQQAGVNLYTFGALFVLNAGIGLIMPPVGLCLYMTTSIFGVSIEKAARAALPFVLVIAANIALVMAVPWLTTALSNVVSP
jgi:C4-dicarboxylate transporter, DctM subunit